MVQNGVLEQRGAKNCIESVVPKERRLRLDDVWQLIGSLNYAYREEMQSFTNAIAMAMS